jgi:hypothetical protein
MVRLLKKIQSTEYYMKIREKFYPRYDSTLYSQRKEFGSAMARFNKCQNRKSSTQINAEIKIYKKFWKCYPYDYFLCDLYRQDNHITTDELINYIPGFFWYYLYLPHHTSYKYHLIADNKIISEQFFHSMNIAQPDTFCRIINGEVYSPQMQRWTFDNICRELTQKWYEKLFIKPAEGGGSEGIFVFHKNTSGEYLSRDNIRFNEVFLSSIKKSKDYILQPGILQDPQISKIFPEAVNTCRIVTENKDGISRVICAVLRIGRGQREVDNASVGGIFLKIDIESGRVGSQALSYDYEKFTEHPDTNFVFENLIIPRWDEIRKFAKDSADKLPFFTHLGWDIALTIKGPVAIEVNLGFSIELLQISHGGLREVFGIDDPDYYWKNIGKRS